MGTLALAGLSYWSIRKSNQMIAATQEEVAAVRAQAEAAQALLGQNQELITASRAEVTAVLDQVRAAQATVDEMKVERSLEFRPYLIVDLPTALQTGVWVVRNIGRGPALSCRLVVHHGDAGMEDEAWWGSQLANVGPGDAVELVAAPRTSWDQGVLDGVVAPAGAATYACVCEDQFGVRYRFISERGEPDSWVRSPPPPPRWATWA